MPDSEVETILREIRAQVYAAQERDAMQTAAAANEPITRHSIGTTNGEQLPAEEPIRIDAQLSTIARAWDRLPPVVSNRRGWLARLELWIKGHAGNAMRWFTWEQVNFNAAVHHALKDTQEAFAALEQRLLRLRSEFQDQLESLESERQEWQTKLEVQEAEMRRELKQQTAELLRQRGILEELIGELGTIAELKNQTSELDRRLMEFAQEVREGNERLVAEQRVCFKQLSLESGETALVLDRTRRAIEARLDKLGDSKS